MKAGKGNHNKNNAGGRKGKGKRGGNSNTNGLNSSNHMANRQGRNIDKSSGNYTHDNNSSGRQWVNGEDTRQNKTYKRNHNEKGRRGFYNNDQEDDRTFNVKSMSSMTTASQGNSARKMAETEESKDR